MKKKKKQFRRNGGLMIQFKQLNSMCIAGIRLKKYEKNLIVEFFYFGLEHNIQLLNEP